MKSNKIIGLVGILIAGAIMLTGCNSSSTNNNEQASTAGAQELVKETVDTICTLSGKTELASEDIEVFRDMADKLNSYDGVESDQMTKTAGQLESFANTHEMTIGMKLDKTTTEQFVTGCESSQALYNKTYEE